MKNKFTKISLTLALTLGLAAISANLQGTQIPEGESHGSKETITKTQAILALSQLTGALSSLPSSSDLSGIAENEMLRNLETLTACDPGNPICKRSFDVKINKTMGCNFMGFGSVTRGFLTATDYHLIQDYTATISDTRTSIRINDVIDGNISFDECTQPAWEVDNGELLSISNFSASGELRLKGESRQFINTPVQPLPIAGELIKITGYAGITTKNMHITSDNFSVDGDAGLSYDIVDTSFIKTTSSISYDQDDFLNTYRTEHFIIGTVQVKGVVDGESVSINEPFSGKYTCRLDISGLPTPVCEVAK